MSYENGLAGGALAGRSKKEPPVANRASENKGACDSQTQRQWAAALGVEPGMPSRMERGGWGSPSGERGVPSLGGSRRRSALERGLESELVACTAYMANKVQSTRMAIRVRASQSRRKREGAIVRPQRAETQLVDGGGRRGFDRSLDAIG